MSEVLNEFRPSGQHVLLVTGILAESGLKRIMEAIAPSDFTYEIRTMSSQVAAWLNVERLMVDIGDVADFDLIILPGRTSGEAYDLERHAGVRVVKGPSCYSSLPEFFEEQGFNAPEATPLPRIAICEPGEETGRFLAATYEIPYLEMGVLIDLEIIEDGVTAKEIMNSPRPLRHNLLAEILRARISLPDARNGWVLAGYPTTLRDIEWLEEMDAKPDVYVAVVHPLVQTPILDHYRKEDNIIEILPNLPQQEINETALVRVETLMQTCVAKGKRT